MIALGRALQAELGKLNRTLALLLAFLAPATVVGLNLVRFLQHSRSHFPPDRDPWVQWMGDIMVFWALLMLPLFTALETGLLNAMEHGNKAWKQLFALPTPRWAVYTAKEITAFGLVGLSTTVLLVLSIAGGLLLRGPRPDLRLDIAVPWGTLATCVLMTYVTGWLILALHFWISAHWSSFVVAMGAGIVTTISGVMVVQSEWGKWYPWTMPGVVAIGYLDNRPEIASLLFGLVGGILLSILGAWEVTRRDVI